MVANHEGVAVFTDDSVSLEGVLMDKGFAHQTTRMHHLPLGRKWAVADCGGGAATPNSTGRAPS
jgi:hypothetical protein